MTDQSYIVTLAVPTEEFRRTLAEAIPDATVLRELSRNRVVVLDPRDLGGCAGHRCRGQRSRPGRACEEAASGATGRFVSYLRFTVMFSTSTV